ncbi:hypothetical protein pb186bvf_005646 [Paramecium bursaria]
MNTKIIVNKKVHKLPSNVVTISDISNIVRQIYPKQKNILLWALPYPNQQPVRVDNDNVLNDIRRFFKSQNQPSTKLLVTEDQNPDFGDSLAMLNQTLVSSQVLAANDKSIQNIPIQQDQGQQFQPQSGNQEVQVKVHQQDNSQNTLPVDFRNNEQLVYLVNKLVDERLRLHGIDNRLRYIHLLSKDNFSVLTNQNIQTTVILKNCGTQKWILPRIRNEELGINLNFQDLEPNQQTTLNLNIKGSTLEINKSFLFEVVTLQDQQYVQIGQPFPILIEFKHKQLPKDQQQKYDQLSSLFPSFPKESLRILVDQNKNKSVDELVELLLQQGI